MTPTFDLSFNPALIFWTIVSFGIVYYVVSSKIYPILNKILSDRAAKITTDLAEAERKHQEADVLHEKVSVRLRDVRLEERRILSEAQEKARHIAEEKQQEYQAEFNRLRKAKEEDLRKIEVDFYKNFESKVGKLLVTACEKIMRCDLPAELQQRILEERIQELKKLKGF